MVLTAFVLEVAVRQFYSDKGALFCDIGKTHSDIRQVYNDMGAIFSDMGAIYSDIRDI